MAKKTKQTIKVQCPLSITEICYNKDHYVVKSNKNLIHFEGKLHNDRGGQSAHPFGAYFSFISQLSEGLFKNTFFSNKSVYSKTQEAHSLF